MEILIRPGITTTNNTLYKVNNATDGLNDYDAPSNDTYAGSVKDNPHSSKSPIGNKTMVKKINIQHN